MSKPVRTPKRVRIVLQSEPQGAAVLKSAKLTPLGTTPWTTERDRSPEPLKVLLRLPGYADQTEVIELGETPSERSG